MKKTLIAILIAFMGSSVYAATLTVNNVPKVNTGGATPKLENSAMVEVSGNVGIGTTLPATTLDVIGTIRGSSIQAGTGSATISGDSNGNIGIGTVTAANKIAIGATGQNNFDSNGNLGLGTVNAPQKLYVAGTAETQGFKLNTGAGAGYVLVSSSVGVGTWMTPSSVGAGGGSGTINSGTVNRAAYYSAATTLDSSTKIFTDNTNVGIGTIAPRTSVEIGVQTMNINGANVGIGSTNPGQVLDVNGAIRSISAGNSTFGVGGGNVGIGTATPPSVLYVVGTPMFTTGLNIGIGTASPTRLCIANGAIATCAP